MQVTVDRKKGILNMGLRSEQKQALLCILVLFKEVGTLSELIISFCNKQNLKGRNCELELISPFSPPHFHVQLCAGRIHARMFRSQSLSVFWNDT